MPLLSLLFLISRNSPKQLGMVSPELHPTVEAHGRLAFEQVCRTNVVMKKVISFELLIPYIHSTWIGDQAL